MNVAQNCNPWIQPQGILDFSGYVIGSVHGAFGNHDHVMGKAVKSGRADFFNDVPIKINGFFRYQHGSSPHGNAHIHGKITCIAAHDLHNRAALVGLHGVAQLVDALNCSVCGGVKADGITGGGDVVVDGAGDADHRNAVFRELQSAPEGAVAADGHNAVDAEELTGGVGLLPPFVGHEFLAAGGVEDGAAPIDNVGHVVSFQTLDLAVDEAVPSAIYAETVNPKVNTGAVDCSNSRIHARCVAAGSKNADSFD